MNRFQVKTFPATEEGDKQMEEWLGGWADMHKVERIYTTVITEEEYRRPRRAEMKGSDPAEEKMQTSRVQVIIHLK